MLDRNSVFALEIGMWGIGAILGIAAAFFQFRESGQTSREKETTKDWYRKKWKIIRDSKTTELPEKLVKSAIRWKKLLPKKLSRFYRTGQAQDNVLYIGYAVLLYVSVAMPLGFVGIALFINWPFLLIPIILLWINLDRIITYIDKKLGHYLLYLLFFGFIVFHIISIGVILFISLSVSIFKVSIGLLILSPFITLIFWGLAFPFTVLTSYLDYDLSIIKTTMGISEEVPSNQILLGATITFSLIITFLSLSLGHHIDESAKLPQTFQMLAANLVFDGLTVLTTFWIFGGAIRIKSFLAIPIALCIDVIISAIFACCSLWVGLFDIESKTEAISFHETLNILVGLNQDGTIYTLGPYFWIMHTTFIPTFLFIFIVLICWLAKLIVLPIMGVLEKGYQIESPHHHTAMALALLAAIFVFLGAGFGYLKEFA